MTPDQWSDAIYEAAGMVVTREQAKAIGAMIERREAQLVAQRDRLANDLAQAHRDFQPWIARVGQLIAALDQAEQAMREAGAVYGADAALAALRKEIKA